MPAYIYLFRKKTHSPRLVFGWTSWKPAKEIAYWWLRPRHFHWCDTIVKSTTCGLAQLVCILKKNIKLEAWMVSVKLMTRFFFPIDHNFDNLYEHANSPNQCSKSSKGTSRRERRERKKKHNILSTKWGNWSKHQQNLQQLLLARGHGPFFLSLSLSLFHVSPSLSLSLVSCLSPRLYLFVYLWRIQPNHPEIVSKIHPLFDEILTKVTKYTFGSPWRLGFLVWRPCFSMCDMADMSYDLDCATGNHPSNFHAVLSFGPKNCHCRCSELEVSQLWANNGFILCR